MLFERTHLNFVIILYMK